MNATSAPIRTDVAVIGAGAAGLMCALTAGQRGRRVRVIEHANKVGKKILMSGGGRCNFTNTGTGPDNFLSANPHFCKSALARYRPADFVQMVERHGITYHEKELGQLFCDISSKQIVRMLVEECDAAGVNLRTQCSVHRVERGGDGFHLDTDDGPVHTAALVVASGGLSIPSLGASGFGYALARQFGHAVLPTRAGLVPLTLSGKHQERLHDLSGLALPVEASCNGASFRNFMLITHRGISGPAILQISSYWQPGDDLRLDLLPGQDAAAWLRAQKRLRGAAELRTVLGDALPPLRAAPVRGVAAGQTSTPTGRTAVACHGRAARRVAAGGQRHRGLSHRRGHPGRGGYRRGVLDDDGIAQNSRPVLRRRGTGRERLARRLQLPMGLGLRPRRR